MSDIQNYFKNSTIFITGGTGFIGSLLVEKLLRTCKDLKQIYVLVRSKTNLTADERFEKFFDIPVFDKLKDENPEVLKKVSLMEGDILALKLGLSDENMKILISEVNCIFHSAANVLFWEKLRSSFNSNVRSVQELLKIAKNINNLSALVYVSTAYTSEIFELEVIHESFYDGVPYTAQQLESLLDNFDDELIEKIKPEILRKCPNVYLLNKSIANETVKKNGNGLPIAVVKPSMITSTFRDPFPGWINNYYGIIYTLLSTVSGFIRILLCQSTYPTDFVPADHVVNLLIASAWEISNIQKNRNIEKETGEDSTIRIYHCVNSSQNPISWGKALNLLRKHYYNTSAKNTLYITTNRYAYYILRYVVWILPAYAMDLIRLCCLKSVKYSKTCKKQIRFFDTVQIVLIKKLIFSDSNTQNLWKKLSLQDKAIYNFNISEIDWDIYCKILVDGIRTYLLREKI